MDTAFWIVTILFMLVSLVLVLIILVQRPSGGGLAGAFGGAGGSGSDTVFGGRVGDALTWATVAFFVLYLGFAIALNLLDEVGPAATTTTTNSGTSAQSPIGGSTTRPVLSEDLGVILGGDLEDFDLSPAEDPVDDDNDDSADDEIDATTKDPPDPPDSPDPPDDPPNPSGGDN